MVTYKEIYYFYLACEYSKEEAKKLADNYLKMQHKYYRGRKK